jgi:hypothetical protein
MKPCGNSRWFQEPWGCPDLKSEKDVRDDDGLVGCRAEDQPFDCEELELSRSGVPVSTQASGNMYRCLECWPEE